MKTLALVNWGIKFLSVDDGRIPAPNKYLEGSNYWFFKYWPPEYEVDVIDYTKIPLLFTVESKLLKFYALQAFRAFARMKKYDLIISHGAQSGLIFSLMRQIGGLQNPPHFIIDVGCFNGGRDNPLELLLIKYSARSLAGVIHHASIQENYYKKHLPFLRRRFIPFGVDPDYFAPIETGKSDYIISVGYAKRDFKTLLEAWSEIGFPKPLLKIVGSKKLGGVKNLPPHVELIGRVNVDEYRKLIGESNFVVLPLPYYRYAYGQMTLLQSMSMAKAVVVTRTPSTIDYVNDGENAIFVEPGDARDLKAKMELLMQNPLFPKAIGVRARLKVIDNFTEKMMAEKIYKFVIEIMQSNGMGTQ